MNDLVNAITANLTAASVGPLVAAAVGAGVALSLLFAGVGYVIRLPRKVIK